MATKCKQTLDELLDVSLLFVLLCVALLYQWQYRKCYGVMVWFAKGNTCTHADWLIALSDDHNNIIGRAECKSCGACDKVVPSVQCASLMPISYQLVYDYLVLVIAVDCWGCRQKASVSGNRELTKLIISLICILCVVYAQGLVADAETVIKTVMKFGSDQWYEIGLALHLNHSQVIATASAIPTHAGRLRALIETRRLQVHDEVVVQELLVACKNIPSGIYGAVEKELKRSGELHWTLSVILIVLRLWHYILFTAVPIAVCNWGCFEL